MIKAENTSIKGRINLVDTSIPGYDDDHYIRQISEDEAIFLLRSLLSIFIPIKDGFSEESA